MACSATGRDAANFEIISFTPGGNFTAPPAGVAGFLWILEARLQCNELFD